jgi:endonuclease/exonuclease/phosphatase family metal-dependent hydrolase
MRDFSFTPRNLQHVQIDLGGKNVNVFNTQGIWGFDGDDNERRIKMSETIREKYQGKEDIILCGDFNTKENTKAMTSLEQDLKNVFKGELKTSFNLRHKPVDSGFTSAVVDMVYVSPEIKVLEHYSTDEDVSDHVPLVCVFDI